MLTGKKHILIVTSEFPPQPGGIGTHAYQLAKSLTKHEYNISVLTDQRSVSGFEEVAFDAELPFNMFRIKRYQFRYVMYFKRLYVLFRHLKGVDTVIASGKFSLWIVAFASLFFKRQYFAVLHGSEVNFTNKLLKLSINVSLKRFTKLIAVSNYTKSLIMDIGKPIVVIPNGIDIQEFQDSLSDAIELKGYPKLLTVGNVTDRKGQLNVIKHLPELLLVYPNLHYHCVGLPTEQEAFMKVAKNLNVDEFITFHGRVSEEKLHSFLKSCDVFIMLSHITSSGDVEGFGISLLEANYFGLPCIGAKNCGIEDAISDYLSGRLIDYNDTDALKLAINDILLNTEDYKQRAITWAISHDWNSIVNPYISVINS